MKCIYCDKKAEYIIAGNSVCKKHTDCISEWSIPSLKEFRKGRLSKYIEKSEETK